MMVELRTPLASAATLAFALAACAGESQSTSNAKEPSSSPDSAKVTTSGPSCNPKVGAKAPALTIASMNGGGKATIAPGKVTLVDFWATWCKPCRKSFPSYQALYTKYKSQGFELIAISADDETNDIPGFIKQYGAKFPVGFDKGHTLADCWKPANMPTAYLIDRKGIVREIHNKWEDGDEKDLDARIKSLL